MPFGLLEGRPYNAAKCVVRGEIVNNSKECFQHSKTQRNVIFVPEGHWKRRLCHSLYSPSQEYSLAIGLTCKGIFYKDDGQSNWFPWPCQINGVKKIYVGLILRPSCPSSHRRRPLLPQLAPSMCRKASPEKEPWEWYKMRWTVANRERQVATVTYI